MIQEPAAKPIHLIVIDVVMPGLNGNELPHRLMSFHPEMKVLYIIRKGFLSAIDIDAILFSKYLREVYETFPIEEIKDGEYMYSLDRSHYDSKDFEKMVKRDLDFLNEKYFNTDFENNRIIVDYDYLKPIICLILEAQIKYEFNTQETVEYLEQLVLSIWV